MRNCIDLEKDHFLRVLSSFCVWAHTEGLTPLYMGGSFLTIAVQGLTEASKPRAEERRGRGEDTGNGSLELTSSHRGSWSQLPGLREVHGLPVLTWLVTWELTSKWLHGEDTTSSPSVMPLENWSAETVWPWPLATVTREELKATS